MRARVKEKGRQGERKEHLVCEGSFARASASLGLGRCRKSLLTFSLLRSIKINRHKVPEVLAGSLDNRTDRKKLLREEVSEQLYR